MCETVENMPPFSCFLASSLLILLHTPTLPTLVALVAAEYVWLFLGLRLVRFSPALRFAYGADISSLNFPPLWCTMVGSGQLRCVHSDWNADKNIFYVWLFLGLRIVCFSLDLRFAYGTDISSLDFPPLWCTMVGSGQLRYVYSDWTAGQKIPWAAFSLLFPPLCDLPMAQISAAWLWCLMFGSGQLRYIVESDWTAGLPLVCL